MAQGAIIGQQPPETDLTGLASETWVQSYVQQYVQKYVKDNVSQSKFEIKTYTGTGSPSSGNTESNAVSIQFSFKPRFVIIFPYDFTNTQYYKSDSFTGGLFYCDSLTENYKSERAYSLLYSSTDDLPNLVYLTKGARAKLENNKLSFYHSGSMTYVDQLSLNEGDALYAAIAFS